MTDPKEKAPPIKTRTPGRLGGGGMFDRVKLRDEPHPIEEILYGGSQHSATDSPGTTDSTGSTGALGTATPAGTTSLPGTTSSTVRSGTTKSHSSTTRLSTTTPAGSTRRIGTTGRVGSTRRPGSTETTTAVSPERDFHKVPNSITREALAAGLFKGKSKAVWDYLWRESRGAIVPSRTVRRSRPQLKAGAGFGSMGTVDAAVRHLQAVGLISVTKIVGEADGNVYEVFTPEEVAARAFSLPDLTGSTDQTGTTETTQNPVVPVVPENGSTGTTLNLTDSDTSGGPKTSFKTTENKTDDEAFADLIALLKQATGEVTGKEPVAAERDHWREVGELLVAELKQGASRTTVSSVPAFLAEHLRRRLTRQPAPQRTTKPPTPVQPASPPEPPTDDELVEMFTSFLHEGMTVNDLDGQLSASIDPERWPRIRAAALERYERERDQMRPLGQS